MTSRALLPPEDVQAELASVSTEWSATGSELRRTVTFPSFLTAVQFIGEMAPVAERLDHHPDITLSWRNVDIVLSTHSAGGLTALDFQLARGLDPIISRLR